MKTAAAAATTTNQTKNKRDRTGQDESLIGWVIIALHGHCYKPHFPFPSLLKKTKKKSTMQLQMPKSFGCKIPNYVVPSILTKEC